MITDLHEVYSYLSKTDNVMGSGKLVVNNVNNAPLPKLTYYHSTRIFIKSNTRRCIKQEANVKILEVHNM